jgi:hypothetical protein
MTADPPLQPADPQQLIDLYGHFPGYDRLRIRSLTPTAGAVRVVARNEHSSLLFSAVSITVGRVRTALVSDTAS